VTFFKTLDIAPFLAETKHFYPKLGGKKTPTSSENPNPNKPVTSSTSSIFLRVAFFVAFFFKRGGGGGGGVGSSLQRNSPPDFHSPIELFAFALFNGYETIKKIT